MDGSRSNWQRYGLILVAVLLTVASFASLVHRHTGAGEQGCVLCHVRQEPGLDSPAAGTLPAPTVVEPIALTTGVHAASQDLLPVHSGRAPPASL